MWNNFAAEPSQRFEQTVRRDYGEGRLLWAFCGTEGTSVCERINFGALAQACALLVVGACSPGHAAGYRYTKPLGTLLGLALGELRRASERLGLNQFRLRLFCLARFHDVVRLIRSEGRSEGKARGLLRDPDVCRWLPTSNSQSAWLGRSLGFLRKPDACTQQ